MQSEDASADPESPFHPLEHFEDDDDIDESIEMEREAIRLAPDGDPDIPLLLNNLGFFLLRRFEHLGNLADVNESIELRREAVRLTPEDHPDKPGWLNNLANSLFSSFEHVGNLADLDECIEIRRDVIQLTPDDHPDKPGWLNSLGSSLFSRFEHVGNLADLDERIEIGRDVTQLTPNDHPDKPGWLNNLGNSLFSRFEHVGNLADLNECIEIRRDVIQLTPDDHPGKFIWLENLGSLLFSRFEHHGSLDDINECVDIRRDLVRLTPEGHAVVPGLLDSLGNSLLHRFEALGNLNDINESIGKKRDAVRLTPEGHPDMPARLNNLGTSLYYRSKRLGNLDDIDESIKIGRDALHFTPDGHPEVYVLLNNLGTSLSQRFDLLGNLDDINESIEVKGDALQLAPEGHPDKPNWLNNLGSSLLRRFERLGNLDDLNQSIEMKRHSVKFTPAGHPDMPGRLSNLGNSLAHRFERLGNLNDIDEAIKIGRDVVQLAPVGHPTQFRWMHNLADSLFSRFERLGKLDDINESVKIGRDAVRLIPEAHADKPVLLNHLGTSLSYRFKYLGNLKDIDESIEIGWKAIQLTPEGHLAMSGWLNNLGTSLLRRFRRLGNFDDINKAIEIGRDAVRLTPEGHPDLPGRLTNLGDSLLGRFDHGNNSKDAIEAIEQYSSAAQGIGPPYYRFEACSTWSQLAQKIQHPSYIDAYSAALHILPQLAWLGSPISDRHFQIQNASAVVRSAAAAINADNRIMSVEWLEQGRSIIWGQILQLRTPLDALKTSHPDLGSGLERISLQLEGSSTASPLTDSRINQSLDAVAEKEKYHDLTVKREKLIETIRGLPGFERFLLPKPFSELVQAAKRAGGHIVMLNASRDRCDALILSPTSSDQVVHVLLPDVSLDKAMTLHEILQSLLPGDIPSIKDLGDRFDDTSSKRLKAKRVSDRNPQEQSFPSILLSLWKWIVEPIVKALSLTTDHLGRLWWCPTGIFSFLPFHAAGDYAPDASIGSKLMDYVISSYTPSVTALLQALDSRPQVPHSLSILAVVQPAASGQKPLPGTKEELKHIENQTKGTIPLTKLIGSEANINRVKDGMIRASSVHFACHGTQNVEHPTESALLLAGNSKLTLSEIIMMKLGSKDLAFLSACQTATGDATLSDEAVHLAAGMLLAGYRSVIATMWTIDDSQAPRVANDVYSHLFRDPDTGATKAAEALHFAVKNLQTSGANFNSWVSFIHFGI